MKSHAISLLIVIALAGCSGRSGEAANENTAPDSSNELPVPVAGQPAARSIGITKLGEQGAYPDNRTPVPKGEKARRPRPN